MEQVFFFQLKLGTERLAERSKLGFGAVLLVWKLSGWAEWDGRLYETQAVGLVQYKYEDSNWAGRSLFFTVIDSLIIVSDKKKLIIVVIKNSLF